MSALSGPSCYVILPFLAKELITNGTRAFQEILEQAALSWRVAGAPVDEDLGSRGQSSEGEDDRDYTPADDAIDYDSAPVSDESGDTRSDAGATNESNSRLSA